MDSKTPEVIYIAERVGTSQIKPGMRFIGNGGYEAIVIEPTPGVPGMFHVRYPGGVCCQCESEIQMFMQRQQVAA